MDPMAGNPALTRVGRASLVCAALLAFTACTHMPEVNEHEVVGAWSFSAAESGKGMPGPKAEIELHADHTLAVKEFPLRSGFRETLSERAATTQGSWEFVPRLGDEGHPMYDTQSGVELKFTQLGPKVNRIISTEKDDDGTVRLVIYVGFPDVAEDKYVLTKNE